MSENTTPAAQELAAAIRDALNPPAAATRDAAAARTELIELRAAHVHGALLLPLAEYPDTDDLDADVRSTAATVRQAAEWLPVGYETKEQH